MAENQENLLDKKGIAKFLSISIRQVDRLKLPSITVGTRERYSPSEVLVHIKHESTGKK